jgi:predicted dehydrogenase
MGDAFADHLENSYNTLVARPDIQERVQVPPENRFVGFDAYKQVIEAADVVLLATSPFFRPMHVAYAVERGRHLFVEKPVAVDATGLRSILESTRQAKEKGLSLVSGLCYRYQFAKQETVRRIQEGAVGDIRILQCTYNTGELWYREPQPGWTDMDTQMRNWLYFDWLSGDHIAEQHIHSLDKLAWAMGNVYPIKATSSGGRSKRTDPKFGNVYDHFNTVYEWEDGVVGFSSCRQMSGCATNVSDYVYGTKGVANIQNHSIKTDDGQSWRYRSDASENWSQRRLGVDDMYQNEHDALFWSIRSGEPINNGEYMANSTMMAIMGRLAAYTGKTITWEQAWNSTLDLTPAALAFGPAPECTVAVPGVTPFV